MKAQEIEVQLFFHKLYSLEENPDFCCKDIINVKENTTFRSERPNTWEIVVCSLLLIVTQGNFGFCIVIIR